MNFTHLSFLAYKLTNNFQLLKHNDSTKYAEVNFYFELVVLVCNV